MALVVVVISIIGSLHSYCWKCNKKYESVVSKAKRPREQNIVDAGPESSELVKARQAVAKLEAACAADPDDAECKELYERKKQRLEQLESERDSPFDLLRKLKASREKLDKKRKQSESGHEKVRKEQEESERVDREIAEMEDQHRQLEQRHRASAEQEQQRALEANATYIPLDVWEGLQKLQAEVGINAPRGMLMRFSSRSPSRLRQQGVRSSRPSPSDC